MAYVQTNSAKTENFDEILVHCIHNTIAEVIGSRVWDTIYLHLVSTYGVTKGELPSCLESLQAVLGKALGPIGARTISRAIAKKLYAELHIDLIDKRHSKLVDYVAEARNVVYRSRTLQHRLSPLNLDRLTLTYADVSEFVSSDCFDNQHSQCDWNIPDKGEASKNCCACLCHRGGHPCLKAD